MNVHTWFLPILLVLCLHGPCGAQDLFSDTSVKEVETYLDGDVWVIANSFLEPGTPRPPDQARRRAWCNEARRLARQYPPPAEAAKVKVIQVKIPLDEYMNRIQDKVRNVHEVTVRVGGLEKLSAGDDELPLEACEALFETVK